jgi:hypothetical protein
VNGSPAAPAVEAKQVDVHGAVPEHLSALLSDLVENQRRLRVEMNSGMAASAGAGPNPKHIALGESLTKASIALSRELRAWSKTTREASKNLSVAERIALVVAFINSLSIADRRSFDELLHGD